MTNSFLLFTPTNAQHIHSNNILYTVSTPTCFDAFFGIFKEYYPSALLELQKSLMLQTQ